ncbi:class I SAM-dependent methyltransferase [Saccharomonospora halophila]|uniref:class I SAM-dependent methyltransferase n=1 Tax=Saccharomonospora halophila TaxID=129922 RepID=UPI0003AA5B40|nr:class I SAM-dependent methyltransferase [Saccharomonospora halophila]
MRAHAPGPQDIGTRDDPHAQARRARHQPLLLHSMALFREIFEIVFAHRDIRTVVEVGVESGAVSGMYAELGASTVYCIEPRPTDELRATLAGNEALRLVTTPSPRAFTELPVADLYVLDGDHNYATVHRELEWILTHAPDATVVCHDLLWPCSRRDLYYQPSTLPPEDRNPAGTDGPTVWHDELTPAGFVGMGAFTSSTRAGGDSNGVLTAVEDVLRRFGDDPWHLELVPAIFGMGVLVRRASTHCSSLMRDLRPYSGSGLLAAMENNRIALYTRVLQLQHEAAVHARNADRMADTISAQCREIDTLTAERASPRIRHERGGRAPREIAVHFAGVLRRAVRGMWRRSPR